MWEELCLEIMEGEGLSRDSEAKKEAVQEGKGFMMGPELKL